MERKLHNVLPWSKQVHCIRLQGLDGHRHRVAVFRFQNTLHCVHILSVGVVLFVRMLVPIMDDDGRIGRLLREVERHSLADVVESEDLTSLAKRLKLPFPTILVPRVEDALVSASDCFTNLAIFAFFLVGIGDVGAPRSLAGPESCCIDLLVVLEAHVVSFVPGFVPGFVPPGFVFFVLGTFVRSKRVLRTAQVSYTRYSATTCGPHPTQ